MIKTDYRISPSVWQSAQWRPLDTVLWCYFFLPVVIFLIGFFVAPVGIPVAIVAIFAGVRWLPGRTPVTLGYRHAGSVSVASFGVLAAFAAAWAMLGGAGHMFYANAVDWVPRFAILHDLVVKDWPPLYVDETGHELILRAPVAYYLPTAWLARNVGMIWADTILLGWTWLGVSLFFVANLGGSLLRNLSAAVLFALASGLDIVGLMHTAETLPWLGSHIEWWAGRLQYSSNTTLLFWVPNHALPGWIGALWLWRFRDDPRFVSRLPMLFLPVMLWSPLPAIGLLPLAVAATAVHWYSRRMQWAEFFKSLAWVAPPAVLVAAYLMMSAGSINAGASGVVGDLVRGEVRPQAVFDIQRTFTFFILEVGLFGLFALQRDRSPLVLTSLIVLAVLPWLYFGPNNDLAMRGSIPALTILWLVLISELTAPKADRVLSPAMRSILSILWLLGMATPFQEIYRAVTRGRWAPDITLSAPTALRGFPSHYFAPLERSLLKPVFRES